MKKIIDRLIKLQADAEAIRVEIEARFDDGDIIGLDLHNTTGSINSTIGALLVNQLKSGLASFNHAMRWTDVNEQMPDDDTEVLVAFNDDSDLAYHDSDSGWMRSIDDKPISGVTHWMEVITPEVQP